MRRSQIIQNLSDPGIICRRSLNLAKKKILLFSIFVNALSTLYYYSLWFGNAINLAHPHRLAQSLVSLIQQRNNNHLRSRINSIHNPPVFPLGIYWWYQQLPKIADNLRQQCSRRPGSVQPASVPSASQQVSDPGHVRQSRRVGTCPLWTSDSPTTLACMLICIRAWPASTGCPSTGISHPTCSRTGRHH